MKVLVTGATGFLGKQTASRLLAKGHQVTALGRNPLIGLELESMGAHFAAVELNDKHAMIQHCQGKELVIHCGALSSPWGKFKSFYDANVLGTRHIVEGCMKYDVSRLIHVSTPSIYFEYRDRTMINEQSPLPKQAVNAYAHTKKMAEALVDEAYHSGLPVITLRPRALFGPGDNAIFPRLIRANQQRFVPLINKGQAVIDITYIDNVVDAVMLGIGAPKHALGNKYNITNGEPKPLKELLDAVFAALDMPVRYRKISYPSADRFATLMEWGSRLFTQGRIEPLLTRYTVGTLGFTQTLDISAAKQNLQYTPRISLDEGITMFAAWWRDQHEIG